MADVPSPKEISGTIPFFFYDVIGRIFPGGIFILWVIVYFRRDLLINWTQNVHVFPKDSSAGYSLTFILVFFGVAYFFGILLSALSFLLLEKWYFKKKRPLNFDGLKKFLGADTLDELSTQYESHFGHKLIEAKLNESSFLCAYYAWKIDSKLGMMTATNDAEALAGRSLALLSLFFFLIALAHLVVASIKVNFTASGGWWAIGWVAVMIPIAAASFVNFDYARRKRVYIRYSIFLAMNAVNLTAHSTLPPLRNKVGDD